MIIFFVKSYVYFSGEEFLNHLHINFPYYNERLVTLPVSLKYKVNIHGVPDKRKDILKSCDEDDKKLIRSWDKEVSGKQSEVIIFNLLQQKCSGEPSLLVSSFCENYLFKVIRENLQNEKKGIELNEKVLL